MTGDSEDVPRRRVGDAAVVREAFEAMPVLLAALDGPDHVVVAANAAYREFVGRPDDIGRPVRELFPEVAGQQLFELVDRAYATGEPVTAHQWRVQIAQGVDRRIEDRYLDFLLVPWRAADGRVRGLAVALSDVTQQVRERQAAQERAAQAERRYTAARDVVMELQEALLPTTLPLLPRAQVAARYLVAGHDQAAGGDWFDAVPLPDGTVALAVGDVVGHGVTASAAMGQFRAVLNDRLLTEPDLASVLAHADGFAARYPALRAATLCLAVLDPATGVLRYSTCGHPPPLVVTDDGSTKFLPGTRTGPLGTGSVPVLARSVLQPGELVLLYSDGLIERPSRTLDEGMAELAAVALDAAADRVMPVGAAPTAADRVCQLTVELLTRTGYADDVTTLAAQRLPAPVPAFDCEVPAELASLSVIRRSFAGWLAKLGSATQDRQAVELAVVEAVTNAVEHAYPPGRPGPVRVHATLRADGCVECRVSDRGRWRPPAPADTTRGRGLLIAGQTVDELRVDHPADTAVGRGAADTADAAGRLRTGSQPDPAGTVVLLRHRLHRPAMLASDASAAPAGYPPAPAFAVETQTGADDSARVRVRGVVDATTAEPFSRELLTACRGGVLPLTVDLTGVTQLGSAGVRALHEVKRQLVAHRQDLSLVAAHGSSVGAVLELVGLVRAAPGRHRPAGSR